MNPTINRLKIIFLGIFAVGCAGVWAYQIMYVMPAKRCDAEGMWWDGRTRICAQPIAISQITGRPAGMSRREWSEKQAALLNQREAEGYPADAATAAPAPTAPAARAPAVPAKGSAASEAASTPVRK